MFPTDLDVFTHPSTTENLGNMGGGAGHVSVVTTIQDIIEAIEAKIGVDNSAVASSLDYLIKSPSSINPGHKHPESKINFDTGAGHDHDGTDSKRIIENNLIFDTSSGHNHNGTNSKDLTLAKPTKFWAEVKTTGTTLTAQGSATLSKNADYTVTVLQPNSNGFKLRMIWGIVGGFYFTAPRTGYYRLAATTSIRAYGANGPTTVCMRLTQDTSAPTYNADNVDDVATELSGATVLGATDSVDYNDTVCLATQKVVSLTANTTYYFTLQIKHLTSASTINIMTFGDATNSGATLFIEEMRL